MPIYVWKGLNPKGKKRKGSMEAQDTRQVEAFLKRLRIGDYVIKDAPKDLLAGIAFFAPKITVKDVMLFTRQFSTMIDAGLPLVQCLKIMSDQTDNTTLKSMLRDINNSVQSGATLSDALRKYPAYFDSLYCNLVAAGETAGILDTILKRLAEYIEKAEKLKRKVKGALAYPLIVMAVGVIVMLVIMIFVIPTFEEMFSSFGKELPKLTQMVIDASSILINRWYILLPAVIGALFGLKKFFGTEPGRYLFDTYSLKLPVFGDLMRKVAVSKFTRTLATMLQAGVPIITSLDIVAGTAGNKVVEEALIDSRSAIAEGRPLVDPLLESAVFPNMVTSMIAVGEEAGALDVMLLKIADFFDEEVDAAVETVMTMIEPLMIVFLGGTVGTLIIAMYLPIFGMGAAVGG
ncbi:MAG: type II secretion system F family protein [Deltaproteobacteria bacterium]|jgi:type IV pilus assembly protein PilC|nr:type II secretion system F family protein [Deltaproteobacteria bacterium]